MSRDPNSTGPLQRQRLHRQRRRRRSTSKVLNQAELAALLDVAEAELPAALEREGISFHQDARGAIWASIDQSLL